MKNGKNQEKKIINQFGRKQNGEEKREKPISQNYKLLLYCLTSDK